MPDLRVARCADYGGYCLQRNKWISARSRAETTELRRVTMTQEVSGAVFRGIILRGQGEMEYCVNDAEGKKGLVFKFSDRNISEF